LTQKLRSAGSRFGCSRTVLYRIGMAGEPIDEVFVDPFSHREVRRRDAHLVGIAALVGRERRVAERRMN
jgi:hypothetical protein